MADKMLIDATHPEETRVVVLRGNRVEEFDFESANRKQLRGNIYLAKVTRVEPSLQAAFVDYGGNRHGFLAFSEIHPDYYQIPVADRQALIAQEEHDHRAADGDAENRPRRNHRHRPRGAEHRRDADVVQISRVMQRKPLRLNPAPARRRPTISANTLRNRKNPPRRRPSSLVMNRRAKPRKSRRAKRLLLRPRPGRVSKRWRKESSPRLQPKAR